VSGAAVSFMISKMSLKAFTWQRVINLYIPFTFAVTVVVAPQSYYEALQKGVFDGSFWQFWSNLYFSLSWDERMNAPFPTYNHLWYVLYLFIYTLLLLPLFAFINSEKGIQLLSILEDIITSGSRIIWLPFAVLLIILFPFEGDDISHALVDDWYGHYLYFIMMIMGLLFVRMPKIWLTFQRNRYRSLLLGIISYLALLVAYLHPDEVLSKGIDEYWWVIALVVKWSWISLIIGFSRKYLNFSNRALKYCNGIVYPFFILHQTVIIVFGYYVIDWGLSGISEYLIIAFGTFIICGLLCEVFIKRIPLIRVLFGMKWRENTKEASL
jgi:glucan biosynthesis protein C